MGVVVLVGSLVAVVVLLQLPPVTTLVVRAALPMVPLNPGTRLEIRRVSGNVFRSLTLEDVRLRQHERELARLDRVHVVYRIPRLLRADRRVDTLEVDGARISTHRRDGRWDLLDVLRPAPDSAGGGRLVIDRLRVREVAVTAELAPDSVARLRVQDLAMHALSIGDTAIAGIDGLHAGVMAPGGTHWLAVDARGALTAGQLRLDPLRIHSETSEVAGRLVLPRDFRDPRLVDRIELRLDARPLDLADLAGLVPGLPPTGRLRLEARAQGKGDLITGHLAVDLEDGQVTLDGQTRLRDGKPSSVRVHGVAANLDPARLSTAVPAGVLNARLDAELDGPLAAANGSVRLQVGRSRLGSTVVRRLDLSALVTAGAADLTLSGALNSGAVEAAGHARPFDSLPTYRFSGSARGIPGTATVARALAGANGDPSLTVGFRLAGAGTSPDSASVEGRLNFTATRAAGARIDLGHARFSLAGGRLELRPELRTGGGTVTVVGRITLGDTLAYELRQGRIDRVDLGQLTGDTVAGPVSGRFSLAGRGTAPADARLAARVRLDEVRYGTRRIERVELLARLDRGRLRLEGAGALQGGRLVLDALGRPFDSPASYILRRAALEGVDLGTWMGHPELAGPVTLTVTGEGRVRGTTRSGRARVTIGASRVGRIAIAGGDAALTLDGERLTYDARVRTSGGAFALTGDGTPGAVAPAYRVREGRLTSVNLGSLLGQPELSTDLNTTFTADLTPGSLDSRHARLALVLLPSRVNQAELTGGSLEATVDGRRAGATLRADGPDAALDAALRAAPGPAGRTAFGADGTLRLEHLARWTGRREADGRVESRFALTVDADSAGLRGAGGTVDALGGIGGVRVPTLHLAMTPADGELRVDTLLVRSNVASLDGGGRLALRDGAVPGTLALRAGLGDLAPAAALAGVDTLGVDSARVDLAVTGPAWQWRLQGGADAYGAAFGGNLANRVTVAAAATFDSTRVRGVSGKLVVKDAAYGRLSIRELTASGGYDSTVALDLALNVGDSVRLATRLRGTISSARDTVRAELERLTLHEGGRAWALERPATFAFGPRFEVRNLALRSGTRSIGLDGILDRHGTSDLTLRIAALDLEALRATGLVPIGGRVDGMLHLSGPAAAPRLQGRVALAIASGRGQQVGTIGTELDWTDRGLRLAAAATPRRGGALTIEGTLPYRLTLAPRDTAAAVGSEALEADTVSLAVRADSFDLALFQPLLQPDAAKGLTGRLRTDARIGGTIRAAAATGAVSLTGAAVELPTIRVAYQRGALDGRLDGDVLRIDRLAVYTGKKESLTASGTVRLRPLSEPRLDLAAVLRHFRLVNSDQLQTAASGRVQLTGTVLAPELRGNLELDRTNFFVGSEGGQARVETVELTPAELRHLARAFGPAVLAKADQVPGLMDRVRFDLAIRMPRQVWIRRTSSPKTDIELMGTLRVTQQPGQPMQFFGRVEPVPGRGTLELNGRQFRLTDGDISLAGPVDSTKLDVNASYQVETQGGNEDEGVLINVHAAGRLDSLGLDFTSDPAMSEDDILSYIVTGRPTSDNPLFESQAGGGSTGEQLAVGTLAGAISSAAGRGLGFDVFQIRQEPTRGLTLTAGRYLGSRLFLDLELPLQLGRQSRQSPGATLGPGFELEYTLGRWLRAYLRGGSLSPGLLFRARRAY